MSIFEVNPVSIRSDSYATVVACGRRGCRQRVLPHRVPLRMHVRLLTVGIVWIVSLAARHPAARRYQRLDGQRTAGRRYHKSCH
jgi:hypothetical protein